MIEISINGKFLEPKPTTAPKTFRRMIPMILTVLFSENFPFRIGF